MLLKSIVFSILALAMRTDLVLGESAHMITQTILSNQRAPVPEKMLEEYVVLFLNTNPMAMDYLSGASRTVLNQWAALMAESIERHYRYNTASSTTNRLADYQEKILILLQQHQSESQNKVFQTPIDLTEVNTSESVSLPMQLLLSSYEHREKDFKGMMIHIDQQLKKWDGASAAEKNAVQYAILKDIEKSNHYRQNALESFVGLPSAELLNHLDQQAEILKQDPHMTRQHIDRLVHHCKMLHSINSTVVQRLVSVFLYTPQVQSCDDQETGLKQKMIQELIEKIGAIRLKLSEKNKIVFDQLSRITTLTLWNQWASILHHQDLIHTPAVPMNDRDREDALTAVYKGIQENWDQVMSGKECSVEQLQQWLSIHKNNVMVPPILLSKWHQELLDLYNVVQNEGLLPRFYAFVTEQLPYLVQTLSQQLKVQFQVRAKDQEKSDPKIMTPDPLPQELNKDSSPDAEKSVAQSLEKPDA